MEPEVFHFNCSFCGAHPGPMTLTCFLEHWRGSPESDFDALLDAYRTILNDIDAGVVRWKTKKFNRALGNVLNWFGESERASAVRIDAKSGDQRRVSFDCPVCLTPAGPRPKDRYFTLWREACAVQVANLLYESGVVVYAILRQLPAWATPARLGELGDLLALNQRALASVGLLECPLCGRRTTCLYGDDSGKSPKRCRWCLDRESPACLSLGFDEDGRVTFEIEGPGSVKALGKEVIPHNAVLRRDWRRRRKEKKGERQE
ncbi:MAG: hypothetical protein R6X20_07275 [Phycisphaerae bacterium]